MPAALCSTVCNVSDVLDSYVVEQPVLRRAPLKFVVCQLRFPEILGLSGADVRPLRSGIAEAFPDVEEDEAEAMAPTVEGLRPTGKKRPAYRFSSDDGSSAVVLTPTWLALETSAYEHFRAFAELWRRVTALAVDALDITTQERLGLRYVNELSCPAEPSRADLLELVREELVGIVGAGQPQTARLLRSLQEARFAQDDGVLALRHGFVDGGEDGARAYVLDFDYYSDDDRPLDLDAQLRQLAGFNHSIYEVFAWSIPPETFKSFEPREQKE